MDIPAPIATPINQSLIGSEASIRLVKSSSSNTKFSEHFDDNVNQLKKNGKEGPNRSDGTGVVTGGHAKSQAKVRPDTEDSNHSFASNNGVVGEKDLIVVDNILPTDVGALLPNDVVLNAEAGDAVKKSIPELIVSGGKNLPLSVEGELVTNTSISSGGEAGILNGINLADKLAFNPLGNLTPEHFSKAAMKPVTSQAALAIKDSLPQAIVFQKRDGVLPVIASEINPVLSVADFEVSSITTKQSELLTMNGAAQTHGLSQFAQQHGQLVGDVIRARKEGSSEANLNLSAAHLLINADLNTANKAALSIDSPVNSSRWSNDLGKNIQWMMSQSLNGAQIRLNPQQLGPIEIRLQMENGQATVAFTAQHAAAREAIDAALPRLREMLLEQDVNLVDVNVSQHSFAEQQNQQHSSSDVDENSTASEELASSPLFSDDNQAASTHDGLLNEYV